MGAQDFAIDFRSNPYTVVGGDPLPTGVEVTGTYNDGQHGYQNVVATVPVEAGTYRLTLGTCQFGTGTGNVMSETNVELAAFNQNTGVCYDANPATNIVSMTFAVDIDQHITIDCGQYTPYMKLEKILAYAVTFAIGDAFTPASDAVLTPVFSANEADLLNASTDVTVKWFFGESNGAPSVHWEGSAGFLIAQAVIGTKTVDVKLAIDGTSGKFYNKRADKWAQVNANTVFSFPSKEGAIVNVETNSGNVTYDLVDGTLTCNTNDYYSYLEVTYPAAEPVDITANADPDNAGVYYT